MGMFTSGTATIYACPPHRVRTVMEFLERYGLVDCDEGPDRLTLELGNACSAVGTFRFGDASELANMLLAAAPETAFTVVEEPLGEPGTTCSYVPGLGLFAAVCDNDGEALFSQSDVLQWLNEPTEVWQHKLGVPWRTAIAGMPEGTVKEPESAVAHWISHHRELTVHSENRCAARVTVSPADGQTAPDFAAVDRSLDELGFARFRDWTSLDETSQLWRTDVYKAPAT